MRQQALNYTIPVRYEYGRWMRHAGVEQACSRIALWLVRGGMLWLSSEGVAGKTHFLSALQNEYPQVGLVTADDEQGASVQLVSRWLDTLAPHAYWAIDFPAGALNAAQGTALFHLIERAREMNRPLLISWRCDESELAPPELSSRMRMMERTSMQPPVSDADLRSVLVAAAEGLQWQVKDSLLSLMLTRLPRRLPDLIEALKQLEAASLQDRQRITQAWAEKRLGLDSKQSSPAL